VSIATPVPGDLARARVEAAVRRLGPLPVFSGTVARVITLTDDPESATGDIVAAIESDGAFSANLLRYVNSAAAARPLQAQSVRQAVVMVGRLRIRQLALETGTYGFLESVPGNGPVVRGQMHLHALAVAGASAAIAAVAGRAAGDCYLAGLLHDFGKLVMPLAFDEGEADAIARDHPRGALRALHERLRFGTDHAAAGAVLAAASGATDAVVAAIAAHHGGVPLDSPEAACVTLGNALVAMLDGTDPDVSLLEDALGSLGLAWDELEGIAQGIAGGAASASTDIAARVAALDRLAHTDDLTGLPNRRSWVAHVARRLQEGATGAILMADVDHFKQVNDKNGHRYGDLVLVGLGRALAGCGHACRFGGDEFAVWIEGDVDTAARRARDLVARLGQGDGAGPPVGLSVGLAAVDGSLADIDDLVQRADVALYAVKAAGGGGVRLADAA
jgi:diguanylate cyclase (GGDEF)-like protein